MKNLLQRGKYSNKKKSKKRRQSTSSSSDSEEIERKRRKKKRSRWKRKRNSPSSLWNVSSSDSTANSVSEASATDKKFKVILKGEEFKWNLPSIMIEYANNYFNSCILDKDIEKQLLTENPGPSNLQQVKPLNDFIRLLIVVTFTKSHDIRPSNGKISKKNPGSNGPFIPFMESVRGHP